MKLAAQSTANLTKRQKQKFLHKWWLSMAKDVFSKMAEGPCLLNEDGYLNADTDIKEIIYHPSLNVILICTSSGVVRVLDVNAGVVLQSSNLSALNQNEVTCRYIPGQDRILFSDGQAIGVRSDYNGVLLLDSILQKPISNPKEEVKIELPLSEAIILKQSIQLNNLGGCDLVLDELTKVIENAQKQSKKGIKAQKWNTVCIKVPLEDLRSATMNSVSELLLKNQHTPELGVASAVQERLSELTGEQAISSDKRSMASESKRRETFSHWPHMDYKWALPDQMAQAGFYHQPNSSGDDRAMCFTCSVCLVCWERTDEPWSEHERHSPSCPFVMGEYTQNVPLSVTHATNPAIDATYRGVNVQTIGTSSLPHLLPTSNGEGLISVFEITGKISRTHSFFVTQFDSHILDRFTTDFGMPGTWTDPEDSEKKITALAIVGEKTTDTDLTILESPPIRPSIICGLSIKCRNKPPPRIAMSQVTAVQMDSSDFPNSDYISCLYLVVYDFMYSKENDEIQNTDQNTSEQWNTSVSEENPKSAEYVNSVDSSDMLPHPNYNLMKHFTCFYKTLIPGESDEVFLPPPTKTIGQFEKSHTGPRLLTVENTDAADAAQSGTFLLNQDYSFMNGHVLSENLEKSISDHITDLKKSKSCNKLNYSRAVKCVCLPDQYKSGNDFEISDIVVTHDGHHVLVVLRTLCNSTSVLLLYALDFSSKMVQLKEHAMLVRELEPNEKPIEVNILPLFDKVGESTEFCGRDSALGSVVLVCVDGAVRVVDLATLRTTCFAKLDSDKFVSAAYCNSLERLCASTENGSLHFYALNDADSESLEDHEEEDLFSGLNSAEYPSVSNAQFTDSLDNSETTRCFHDTPGIIPLAELKKFNLLCAFEPLKVGYCAVVPPCWSEIQQAQRLRKHLHNLKSDYDQYTKTWRLQTDTTTWDEHLFEITLPTPMSLGHIDVQFNLQSATTSPHVEVTLLRQVASGIGHKRDFKFSVDDTVTIDMLQWADNPVTTQEYLRAHNAEILAGPINIASCLDLTEQSGIVTLTSPKLFRSRNRTLLIHVRAVYCKEELNNKNNNKGKRVEKTSSGNILDKLSQVDKILKKNEFYMGCDCIHELSVIVFTSKHTEIQHEKTIRNLMLESNPFVESLAHTAIMNPTSEVQSLVLNILTWVASIRLSRNRSNNGEPPNHQFEFLTIMEINLSGLLHHCLLLGGRNITHKCMKLMTTCINGAKNINEPMGNHFNSCVLNSLLTLLDLLNEMKSAAGLQWLFALLLQVTSKEQAHLVTAKCVSLLSKIATELHTRTNPYHLLLRSRYGLYGSPMEPELFDIDPPPPPKGTSSSIPYCSLLSGWSPTPSSDFFSNYSFNKESINPKDVMSTSNDAKLKYRNIVPNKMLKGLIETEPLHFTCCSASEGTRLEQADNLIAPVVSGMIPFTVSTSSPQNSNKKYDVQKYWSEVVNVIESKALNNNEASSSDHPKLGESFYVYLEPEDGKDDSEDLQKILADAFQHKIQYAKKPTPPPTFWQTEDILSPPNQSPNLPWQYLLVSPPQQVIIVERMHSGARRHVTLDFGQPVLLTDIIMPSCNDLVTVSFDIWLKGEEIDGTRLVVVSDIATKNLLLNDLQPPPICRYVKITTVGRYGMSTTRCKIPTGYFYGHVVILPEEVPPHLLQSLPNLTATELEKQKTFLSKLFEDISCRYSLACSKLKELLQPYLVADMKNASHLSTYMNVLKDKASSSTNIEHTKVFNAYQEAITYQRQLNTVRNVMARIDSSLTRQSNIENNQRDLPNTSTDKLRSIAEGLLDALLTLDVQIDIDLDVCRDLFKGLCVSQASRLQFLTATFLDKLCGRRKYWGNFLADTLVEMFTTNYSEKFPQDRVFILLAYLGRRSSERSAVIDAALRVVYETLMPLIESRKTLLAVSVDLPLLSWLLMFLSVQLDLSRGVDQSSSRWDWVFGEMVGKANVDSAKGGTRKKPYKRCFVANTTHLTSLTSTLTTKLNAALKAQELLMKKVKIKSLKDLKNSATENILNAKRLKEAIEPICEKISARCLPLHVDSTHCLAVSKGLLCLVLSMDHSSSSDMLLLSFKVMSRLVTVAKVRLGQLMNQDQLIKLVKLCLATKIPWAPHALACLLQDVLDLSAPLTEETEMETDTAASTSWAANDLISDVESLCESFSIDETLLVEPINKPGKTASNNNQLPSVYESDDSEIEDLIVDDFDKKTQPKKTIKVSSNSGQGISAAIDSRLEMGVDASAEIMLRKLVTKNNQTLLQNIGNLSMHPESEEIPTPWPFLILPLPPETNASNNKMLTVCFETLFKTLPFENTTNIEHILQLWLTLNSTSKDQKFDPSASPQIVLGSDAVYDMISAIAWTPGLSLSTWCIALQVLTLVCNSNVNNANSSQWSDVSGMAACIVNHPDFVQFFLKLLSGTGLVFTDKGLAGPTLCKALHDFLVRLLMRSDVVSPASKLGAHLKTLLLDIVCQLVQPSGPISSRQGSMDAQCKLLQSMYYLDYSNADLSIAMSILEYTGNLVHSYIVNVDRIKCVNIGEKHTVTTSTFSTFSDIFASVLCSDSNKQDRPVSGDVLLIALLKLVGKLVQTPFPNEADQSEAMDTDWVPPPTSQTDESKAEQQIQQDTSRTSPPIPCLADLVLQHYPSVIRLCHCLAACKSSSLCMLANVSQKTAFANLSEPNTVGDAVFQVLASIAKKTTKRELLMQPLIKFFSQAPQLSEPLLWFVLQVLDTEEAIRNFLNAGGITILGKSFVTSSNAPNTISKVGTISTVMQHFSGVTPSSDASTAIAASSATKKSQQASIENKLSLINFAPCCSIRCLSGTAQPADVLIQGGGATHRRARTPQWSYHFYPEEVHTDLVLQLPSAILLREVHLQPHLSALATCPSAVALEVSAHGPSRLVPACPPLPTSGMTFIRLHLPIPEIVNCILIRLYKPRDANNIGLSQIRILGNSAFGGSISQSIADSSEDESHCRHSLGWLRLLHHCFTLPTDPELGKQVISAAADVPDLLTTCCGLLLVPSHVLPVYLPCLEKVLRELSLYNLDSGVRAIKVLLESRSSIIEPLISSENNWQDRLLINANGYQSACELLYQICEHQDADTSYRVRIILSWLENVTQHALSSGNMDSCNPSYVSSIASILWTANQSNLNYDLKSMITPEFFDSIYSLKLMSECHRALKYSLDSLLCSLCYIKPEFYPLLLQKIGILVPNLSTDHGASISDDRKDSESMTDDNKTNFEHGSEWYGHLVVGQLSNLVLSNEQLETVALVSRSPTAVQQLLDSGLPKILNGAILEFCSSEEQNVVPMAKLENVTAILKFFTDICDEKTMRDWLGSSDGSSFWMYLLHWLCRKPCKRKSGLQSEARAQLEEVCVKFLSKVCLCHPSNQARLAKVLCNVIALQTNGISGFMRRLILQLLLENEKIPVSVNADETLYKSVKLTQAYFPVHPAFKQTYNRALLYLSTNTTLADILEQHIYFNTSYKMETNNVSKKASSSKKSILKGWFNEDSDLSMAAGVTAKDKRAKDAKNQITVTPQSKKKRYTTSESSTVTDVIGGRLIKCEAYSDQPLPLNLTLGQLLRIIESKGVTADWPCIHLTVCQSKGGEEKNSSASNTLVNQQQPFSSALQVFSSMGGLALLAQHLPTVYPEAVRPPTTEKMSSEPSDSEWIKVEDCDDIYEDIEETLGNSTTPKPSGVISNVPPHSLTAFGLFLRLPGYAEVLLKDMKKALCLLRLVLGVTDDGEGVDIFQSSVADSLPTLPFEVLRKLYDTTPLSTDDGRLLRKISINTGVVHLLLACLGIFTHQTQANADKDGSKDNKNKDDRQLYWAKGTGFGTGSTQQSWNVEQALLKQRCEEEHVTVLLHVLASYVNPNGEAQDELAEEVLPPTFHDLLSNSSLLPALSSYLRNDSVLDMARHIPLYRAALQLLRAIAVSSQLVNLLLPQKSRSGEPSVCLLLKNMKDCVDTYASKLRQNTKANIKFKSKMVEQMEELEQGEGLATLMPDIQDTANLVSKVTNGFIVSDQENENNRLSFSSLATSLEEKYLKVMKNLQFGSYEMIQELPEGGFKFVVSHHFENNAKLAGEQSHPSRVKRIAQEAVTLSTSLPLSYSSSVFVRYDTSRLDVMKVLITGPSETPYANGCLEFDVFFPGDYPMSPMLINLETTGHHSIRFNPNLYNDGKVCLSVLNTWHGRPEEKWNAQTSSFLQVLVSIQSLILVPEPYFNEPGYERSRGTQSGNQSSKEYNHNICQATVRWAMLEQILNPCPCFKDVINAHFYLKRYEIIAQVEGWIKDQESDFNEKKQSRIVNKRATSSSLDNFKKNFQQLKDHLLKLKPPDGIEGDDSSKTPTNDMEVSTVATDNNSEGEQERQDTDMYIDIEKMFPNNKCE